MKTYNEAKLQIVRMNNDIVTASVKVGNAIETGNVTAQSPERRRSIWD